MDRKDFIKTCGAACMGIPALSFIMQSCSGPRALTANISGDELLVPLKEFETVKRKKTYFRKYIIVENEALKYPVCVYRFSENDYSALYMRCTHQGNELNAYGERLVCSAHGSEFDQRGVVLKGPSQAPLKSFHILKDDQHLKISLKSI